MLALRAVSPAGFLLPVEGFAAGGFCPGFAFTLEFSAEVLSSTLALEALLLFLQLPKHTSRQRVSNLCILTP